MKFYCSFEIGEEPEKIKKTLKLKLKLKRNFLKEENSLYCSFEIGEEPEKIKKTHFYRFQ